MAISVSRRSCDKDKELLSTEKSIRVLGYWSKEERGSKEKRGPKVTGNRHVEEERIKVVLTARCALVINDDCWHQSDGH